MNRETLSQFASNIPAGPVPHRPGTRGSPPGSAGPCIRALPKVREANE
jgi:hypothetical protein